MEDLVQLFISIGLKEQKAKETIKNETVSVNLKTAINEAKKFGEISSEVGILLYHLASKMKSQITHHIPLIVNYIVSKKIDTQQRVDAALIHLLDMGNNKLNVKAFEENCGIGIIVTPEQIESNVENVINKYKANILEKRYRFNTGLIMQEVNSKIKWADGKMVKNEVDLQILDLLGPKTEEDLLPVPKKSAKGTKVSNKNDVTKESKSQLLSTDNVIENDKPSTILDVMNKISFHRPGENYKTDGYCITPNTMKILENHLKVTNGQVRTRFPPEPNGILHIGHAKAININFGYAAAKNGICFLRYDDTNPEKEEEQFFIGIRNMVEWLGYKPFKITHSSDYFDQLYTWAVDLINKNLAYVCHQKSEDIKGFNPPPSPWRDRPIDESIQLFEDMKCGKIDEGKATLRLKITLEEGKQDPVAYRIKFLPHHRTGNKWCIYPTYDYTHCLCDSIENITHSLCTKEFQNRRSSYYWLCNALDIYCPVQWEYGRLNMNYTVVSKRKIAKLISEGIVKDWDDPRLFTLSALKRRGFPSEAINSFCAKMGVTGAQSIVDPMMLEASVRDVLNETAPRVMVVFNPLKVTIIKGILKSKILVPDFPNDPLKSSHNVQLDSTVFIDSSDFKESFEKGYRRLSLKQTVGLKHAGLVIKVEEVIKDSNGTINEIKASAEPVSEANKPKAFIQWVSNPIEIKVRLYDRLFKHKNPEDPEAVPGGFLSDVNKDSLKEETALADKSLSSVTSFESFQFERIGFFTVDPDSTPKKLIFNRTVTLKEDVGKI
uniref:glutamine--tRNA ligase n=1 Tax=Clastoptera arizonana TaxID=38151 RepID=A0A1B6C6I6_9HEMI